MLGRMWNNAGKKIFKKNIDFDAANLNLRIKHEYEKMRQSSKDNAKKDKIWKKKWVCTSEFVAVLENRIFSSLVVLDLI